MFYLLVILGIILYYFFMAPKTIKSTINSIVLVALVALLLLLAGMSFMKLFQSPPEIYIIIFMIGVGVLAIRDVIRLSSKPIVSKKSFKKGK